MPDLTISRSRACTPPLCFHAREPAIPHLDQGMFANLTGLPIKSWPKWIKLTILTDIIVTCLMLFILHQKINLWPILWAVAGANLPDIIEIFPLKSLRTWPIFKQISFIHNQVHTGITKEKWYIGLACEVILTGGLIWYLLRF